MAFWRRIGELMGGLVKDWRKKGPKNPDEWLEQAPEFSKSICAQLREWIFRWEPDLEESIKWGALCFKGRKLVVAVGAFRKHANIVFFRGVELPDRAKLFNLGENNVAIRTIRLTTLEGFNREALRAMVHAAVVLDAEPALPPPPRQKREPMPMPDLMKKALKSNAKAAAGFATLSPSSQREYIAWLSSAKQPETRERRLAEMLPAAAAGLKYADRKKVQALNFKAV